MPPPKKLTDWLDIDYNDLKEWLNRFNKSKKKISKISDDELIIPEGSILVFFKKILSGVDAYGLGISLSYVYKKIVGIYSAHGGYNIYYSDKPVPRTKFTDELYVNLTVPFERITTRLMNFSFMNRITVEQGMEEFKALIPVFNTWLSRKEFSDLYIARGRDIDDEHVDGFANTPI
jgi:hypothetical protein